IKYGRIDPVRAREFFIRHALVAGDIDTMLPFVAHKGKLIADIEKLEHKTRRPVILLVEELIYGFYDRQLPADIFQVTSLETWYAKAATTPVDAVQPGAKDGAPAASDTAPDAVGRPGNKSRKAAVREGGRHAGGGSRLL